MCIVDQLEVGGGFFFADVEGVGRVFVWVVNE